MSITVLVFYFFYLLAAVSAIAILFTKNVFKAALYLLTTLLALAALYIFSFAEFVAITQIMIYAGGVVIVVIFGIMLTTKFSGAALKVENTNIFSGILSGGGLFILLLKFLSQSYHNSTGESIHTNAVADTGIALMSTYILPFEVAGLLLLVALIGSAIIASSVNKNAKQNVSH